MPLLKQHTYTSEDYWNLPDSQRAELIDGQLYNMAPPSRMHQRLVMELSATIRDYIRSHHGSCQVYPAPFAVNLDADDKDWVEPDISVICDHSKLTDKGCSGAPDLMILFTSTVSHKMVNCAVEEAKRKSIPVCRCHTSSASALESILREYCA